MPKLVYYPPSKCMSYLTPVPSVSIKKTRYKFRFHVLCNSRLLLLFIYMSICIEPFLYNMMRRDDYL